MKNPNEITFALFFTRGLSLTKWDNLGMLSREIKMYQSLARSMKMLYLFTYGHNEAEKYASLFPSNVRIISKPRWMPALLYSFFLPIMRVKILRTVDVAKTNQMDGSWAAVLTKKMFGAKLVVRCGYEWLHFIEIAKRSFVKRWWAFFVERYAYTNADVIIQTSTGARDFVVSRFGIPLEKIVLIPNYVNTDFFEPKPLPKEEGRVTAVGRLEPQKNLFNLIEAMKGLPLRLVLIGKGSLKEELEATAKKCGVQVEFMGAIPQAEIIDELSKTSIYALPSLYEGHPKTLLEAMSCGVAVVGSNTSGINDTITDGVDGIICETDVESIRHALARLAENADLRARLGTSARKTILDTYSFEKILERELAIYSSL